MNKRRIVLWLIDTAIIAVSCSATGILSLLNIDSLVVHGDFTLLKCFVLYACIMIMRFCGSVYKNIWRYANVNTYLKLIFADILGGLIYILIGRLVSSFNIGFGVSVMLIFTIIILTLLARFVYQVYYMEKNLSGEKKDMEKTEAEDSHKINIAIVGAGNVGASLAGELLRNPKSHYSPYCFVDIDSDKVGSSVNGIKVLMGNEGVLEKLKAMPVQEIVIALPDAKPSLKTKLYEFYCQTGCKVKIYDYMMSYDGKPKGKRIMREISIEDLLFRESLDINSAMAKNYYTGKTVLVTGGGGSIGSELCRQVAALKPKKLVIFDIYENNAYDIQQELINKYHGQLELDTIIGSVRDVKRLDQVFREVKPDIVFHAAAHKHVPLMERSACEAIKNNVVGTYNTANAAEKYGVKKFVLISTDKAVNPTNVMGASKRLCEMILQCRCNSSCEFAAVRFGNVLGSNGSVIPLFKKQIEAGGPVTLTDKRITRYFMTISEAVSLVMEAGAMARNRELYVLDMGKPVKILELAESMIKLSGYRPYEDIDICEIGLRPGEKLYEELLMKTEELDKTSNELIFIERDKPLSRAEVDEKIRILLRAVDQETHESIIQAIRETVPTYCDPDELNKLAIKKATELRTCSNVEEGEACTVQA